MAFQKREPAATDRRTFLADLGTGFVGLSLGAMLARGRGGWR